MHSAKGLEFDVDYVIHAADGNIPSDMATGSSAEIEEERRLLYVARPRARRQANGCASSCAPSLCFLICERQPQLPMKR